MSPLNIYLSSVIQSKDGELLFSLAPHPSHTLPPLILQHYIAIYAVNLPYVFSPTKTFVFQLWKSESMLWKICDYWRPKVNDEFNSVWNKKWGKTQHTVAMEHNLEDYDFGLKDANVKSLKKNTDNVIKPNRCNQCGYASIQAGNLRRHLKTHSGDRSNKCNQFDFVSIQAGDLGNHLKTHSGEKSNKCNQCDFASIQAGDLRRHLKTHSGEKSNKCD